MNIKNLSINGKILTAFSIIGTVLVGGFYAINTENNNVSSSLSGIKKGSTETKQSSVSSIEDSKELKNNIDSLFADLGGSLTGIKKGSTDINALAKKSELTNTLLSNSITEIISKYNPAILAAKDLQNTITKASMDLGFYLLMKSDEQKKSFSDSLNTGREAIELLKTDRAIIENEESVEILNIISADFDKFAAKKKQLDTYVSKRDANMPSVSYASLMLNPKNRSITATLSAMITEGGTSEDEELNKEYADALVEMRHYQVSGAGDIRAYLALRNKSIDSADALYASVKEGLDAVLAMQEKDEDLIDMEFEESFAQLTKDINDINSINLKELRARHSSPKWRMDVHTLNTEISPMVMSLLSNINDLIDTIDDTISMKSSAMENAIESANSGVANIIAATETAIKMVETSVESMNKGSGEVEKKLAATKKGLESIMVSAQKALDESNASEKAMGSVDQIVMLVIGAILLVIILILIFIRSTVSKPIQKGITILNNISAGNLSDEIADEERSDEVGKMMASMREIKNNLTSFNEELSSTVDAAKSGDLEKVIDSESYKGYMADQADQVNYLVHTVKSTLSGINNSLTGLSNGNLDVQMDVDNYEGDYQKAAQAVNDTLDNITELVSGVQTVVEKALAGDLTERVAMKGKNGYSAEMATTINDLMSRQDEVFAQMVEVMSQLSNQDLTTIIENDLTGSYAIIRDNNNAAQKELSKVFADIALLAVDVSEQSQKMNHGNAELASRSEQQASYLEETSSAMEEFTASIQTNATNAKNASTTSVKASKTAKEGGKAVNEVSDTVSEVSEAFAEIASTVGIIDDIAFQTNILAINAAVEAARAGDHGRGFAVVAQEVRNLAQRSADSARDIKELVNNRAKSVSMATELARKAGDTMNEIVESITEVTSLVQEISIASTEQADGVSQVNDAISRLDEMTQQNSHLVDGNNVVAQSLDSQSKELKAKVIQFNFLGKDELNITVDGDEEVVTDSKNKSEDELFGTDDFEDNPFNEEI
jgi:methyl-accepting chemotaxis protein-1 (serine sensor receptor)